MPLFRSIERRHASLKIGRAESPIQQTPETVKPRPRKVGDGGRMSRSTNSLARYENLSRQRIHHICAWKTVRCCCRIGRHRMRLPSLVIREGVSATFSCWELRFPVFTVIFLPYLQRDAKPLRTRTA